MGLLDVRETRINTSSNTARFSHTHHTAPIFKEYRFKLKSARALSELNHHFGVEHTSNLLKLTKTDRIHTHTDTTLSLNNEF